MHVQDMILYFTDPPAIGCGGPVGQIIKVLFLLDKQQFSMMKSLTDEIVKSKENELTLILRKCVLACKYKLTSNQEFVRQVIERLPPTVNQLVGLPNWPLLKYCLRKLNLKEVAEYLGGQLDAGSQQTMKNLQVMPKSIALLPDLSFPCCSDYFIKQMPFCCLSALQDMCLLVQDYSGLTEERMCSLICGAASRGQGVIMIVMKHEKMSPLAGFLGHDRQLYDNIHKLVWNGLMKVKGNEHIRIKLQELPIFSLSQIGMAKAHDEFIVRVVVYQQNHHTKTRMFQAEHIDPLTKRKTHQFFTIQTTWTHTQKLSRVIESEIYKEMVSRPKPKQSGIRTHNCVFFSNQKHQIEVQIENFTPSMPNLPTYPQLVEPIKQLKPAQLQLPPSEKANKSAHALKHGHGSFKDLVIPVCKKQKIFKIPQGFMLHTITIQNELSYTTTQSGFIECSKIYTKTVVMQMYDEYFQKILPPLALKKIITPQDLVF